MTKAPVVPVPEKNRELMQFLFCLGLMIAGPEVIFEWRHRIEQEREQKHRENVSIPLRLS